MIYFTLLPFLYSRRRNGQGKNYVEYHKGTYQVIDSITSGLLINNEIKGKIQIKAVTTFKKAESTLRYLLRFIVEKYKGKEIILFVHKEFIAGQNAYRSLKCIDDNKCKYSVFNEGCETYEDELYICMKVPHDI